MSDNTDLDLDLDLDNPNEERKKKQFKFIIGALVIMVIGFGFFLFSTDDTTTTDNTQKLDDPITLDEPGNSSEKDEWRVTASQDQAQLLETINQMNQKFDTQVSQNEALKNEIANTNNRIADLENRPAEKVVIAAPTNVDPPKIENGQGTASYPNKQGLHGNSILSDPNSTTVDPSTGQYISLPEGQTVQGKPINRGLGIIDMNQNDEDQTQASSNSQTIPSKRVSSKNTVSFIPDGSFVRVVMINGVDAPTGGQAQSDPIPVVFQTVGKIDMPNSYKMNIKGCRFLGSAWGELSTERMKATIVSGSCIINGESVAIDIKGQVVGEDGKTGLRGKVVSKQGQILAKAALASSLEAIGALFGQTVGTTSTSAVGQVKTVTSGELKQSALGGAISGGAEKLSEFYMQRANDLFPIVEISAGRSVEILVQKGAEVPNKFLITSRANSSSNASRRVLLDD